MAQTLISDEQIEEIARHVSESARVEVALPPAPAEPEPPPLDQSIARYIDHTLLKPDATSAEIDKLCQQALEHAFANVCVNPCFVARCVQQLAEDVTGVCTVVGFPLGATTTDVKVFEARRAIANGAHEIDMVLPIGLLKGDECAAVLDDITQVVAACHEEGALCKVIIETALLKDEEKIAACLLSAYAGADFVKTSTGFADQGATTQDVHLMRRVVGSTVGVKAAGGVRTLNEAHDMLRAGATRIGSSAGIHFVIHR